MATIEEQLTAALRAGDFDAARQQAEALGALALASLKSAPDAATRAVCYQSYSSRLADALHLARVLRAHLGAELNSNLGTILYYQTDLEQPRWRLQA